MWQRGASEGHSKGGSHAENEHTMNMPHVCSKLLFFMVTNSVIFPEVFGYKMFERTMHECHWERYKIQDNVCHSRVVTFGLTMLDLKFLCTVATQKVG